MRASVAYLALAMIMLLSTASLGAINKTLDIADDNTQAIGQHSYESLVMTVIAHADNMLPQDELIEFNGVWVKKSNYHGVVLGDRTYYYCLAPHQCSCPVCRGILDPTAAHQLWSDESTDFPMAIYELHYDEQVHSINLYPYTVDKRWSADLP